MGTAADFCTPRRAVSGSAALWALLWMVVIVAFAATAAEIVRGATSEGPAIGQPAPDFSATDSQGKTRHLADFRGKTVVLEWTNADCPYTRKHYATGNMQSLQALARRPARKAMWTVPGLMSSRRLGMPCRRRFCWTRRERSGACITQKPLRTCS
jgi:hypothetical protein